MEKLPIEWVAGFFDGEGCAKIGKQAKQLSGNVYPHATLMLSQSGEDGLDILQRIQKQFGGKIYHHLKPGEHKATKHAYKLYWNKDDGLIFLNQIIPFLHLKQKDAKLVKDYYERKASGNTTI